MKEWTEIPKIKLYSDGGADPNPGKAGYGIILSYKGRKKEFNQGYFMSTNNRMELMGVITGLEKLKTQSIVDIYTDSKYVINGIEKGWAKRWKSNDWYRTKKEKAINADLWERLLNAIDLHEVAFHWVKGHNGHLENERCDELATLALQSSDLIEDKGFIPKEDAPSKTINVPKNYSPSNDRIKITQIGQDCRKCGTPVIKKTPTRKKIKKRQAYYFEYYLYCPNCRTMYMLEEAKQFRKDTPDLFK
jgi:ribonuclease HI